MSSSLYSYGLVAVNLGGSAQTVVASIKAGSTNYSTIDVTGLAVAIIVIIIIIPLICIIVIVIIICCCCCGAAAASR